MTFLLSIIICVSNACNEITLYENGNYNENPGKSFTISVGYECTNVTYFNDLTNSIELLGPLDNNNIVQRLQL